MKTFCLLLAMLCLGPYVLAQKHIADSLVLLAEKATGIEKATHYNDAAREFIKHDPRKGIEYAANALEIATRENDFTEIYNALYSIADAYLQLGLYDSARITNLNTIEKHGNRLGNARLAQLHNHLGSVYTNLHNNEKAIELLTRDAEIKDLVIKRRNTPAYALTGVIALLSVSGFLFFGRQREKQRREKIEMEKRNLETVQQLLRAQINPHFIFNALNSVQSYLSANDELKAMSYLAKFSNLMRNILENSMKKMITIEEELETLQLYMELESMRFRNAFDFEFCIHEKIDPTRIYIPPMLIQPFVENSIKHGFLNLEGKGHILIDFYKINGVVSCKIEDNGVGRPQMLAEDKLAAQHRSLGMQLTRDRLHALQQDWNVDAKFDVEDLTSADGKACGTRVLIDMPYEVE